MATIPFSSVLDQALLPIDAQEVCTQARTVLTTTIAGMWRPVVYRAVENGVVKPYHALPVVGVVDHLLHPTYQAVKSAPLRAGIAPPFRAAASSIGAGDSVTSAGFNDVFNARDGDGTTVATAVPGSASNGIYYDVMADSPIKRTIIGARLIFASSLMDGYTVGSVTVTHEQAASGGNPARQALIVWDLPDTAGVAQDVYLIAPPDIRMGEDNQSDPNNWASWQSSVLLRLNPANLTAGGQFQAGEFHPLSINQIRLNEHGRYLHKVPATDPRRVTVDGYVPPDESHTITDWMGQSGVNFTGAVAQQLHHEGTTIIDFEQPGPAVNQKSKAAEFSRALDRQLQQRMDRATIELKLGERQ